MENELPFDEDGADTVPGGVAKLEAEKILPGPPQPELLIITGLSGAGRSRAAQAVEDLDFYVVDNLPPQMLVAFADMLTPAGGGVHRLAAVVDVRSGKFFNQFLGVLDELNKRDIKHCMVFLDADDSVLVRRYESNRRPHPLQEGESIISGIQRERTLLEPIRSRADVLIDTTYSNVHDLDKRMRDMVAGAATPGVSFTVMSFGFKYGIPLDADWVGDARFLKNPYWVSELRHLTGQDQPVYDYVFSQPGAVDFAKRYVDLLLPIVSGYETELKPYVTVAIGCTGGKHRSVALAERIGSMLRDAGIPVTVLHRDMGKE
ncbi:MAG: RNase adapter RapZ [Varibaculum sp.]|nr:RNase adapter RapZ [Varibaculum sp.]